ncbi:MAG: hypothetical protein RBR74_06485 [Ignavibacteriaceae bacterium]|jgi:hypothetical protein|nr:hypothetical protein [Ignavibacteriaceae bacterium]
MNRIFTFLLAALTVLVLISCKDNSTAPVDGGGGLGGGGGGGGTGNVTFTVNLMQDQQGAFFFQFTPSTAVVIDKIIANCAAAGVNNEEVPGDGTTLFNTNGPARVDVPENLLAQGQQWSFTIVGKVGSSTGANYTSTVNYTIPNN